MKRGMATVAMAAILCGSMSAEDTGPIVCERIVEAPLDAVWEAWTTSAGLRSWLAPHADIDLRVGGRMRTNYSPQGTLGDPKTIENTVLSFDPRRMMSIKVAKAPDGFPFPNAIGDMWTVIYLEAAGPDRTQVRIVGLGFRPDEESQKMRAFFERGNASTLEQLQRHLARVAR